MMNNAERVTDWTPYLLDSKSIAELRERIRTVEKPAAVGYTPIVPEDGLYLWDWGQVRDNEKVRTPKHLTAKFVRAFKRTWAKLPERDRCTLLMHWNKYSGPDYPTPTPKIEFNSFCLPRTFAASCKHGFEFLFCVRSVEYHKPIDLQHIIAHELGHGISYAHGWAYHHECRLYRGRECTACECQAHSYMASWGFDPFRGLLPKGPSFVDRCDRTKEGWKKAGLPSPY